MIITEKICTFAENKSYRNMAKRKIGFYYLFFKRDDVEMPIEANLLNVLAFLGLKSRVVTIQRKGMAGYQASNKA